MHVRVNKGGPVPVSRQIADQVRSQVLAGRLAAGERLPSVRALARELVVNANTVARVYERLAAEGLVETRQGEGTFVLRPDADPGRLDGQVERFGREFDELVRRGLLLGLTTGDLRGRLTAAAAATREELKVRQSHAAGDESPASSENLT